MDSFTGHSTNTNSTFMAVDSLYSKLNETEKKTLIALLITMMHSDDELTQELMDKVDFENSAKGFVKAHDSEPNVVVGQIN